MKKLNTKNCCFLCLRKIKIEGHNEKNESVFHPNRKNQNLLRCLIRHLKINLNGVGAASSNSNIPSQNDTDVEVDLCEDCVHLNSRFSKLFLQLEKIQMEMEFYLGRIHHCLLESSKNADLVQNYSKEMTSDRETLAQLAFVDKLRKEIADKSPRLAGVNPTVNLTPIEPAKVITVKQEAEEIEDFDDTNYFEDHNPERCSPTPEDSTEQLDMEFSSELKAEVASEPQKLNKDYSKVNKYCSKNLSTGLYHCSICDKPLKRPYNVQLHYEAIHLNKKFNCDGCSRPFSQYAGLQQHKKICNGVVTVKIQKRKVYYNRDIVTGMFQCTKCEQKSPHNATIVAHYENVHLKKRFKCEICNMEEFVRRHSLKMHMETCRETLQCLIMKKDGEKIVFVCKLCEKQFPTRLSFKAHRRVHMNIRYSDSRLAGVNSVVYLTPTEDAEVVTVKQNALGTENLENSDHPEDHNPDKCSPTPEVSPEQLDIGFSSELKPEVTSDAQKQKRREYSKVNKYCSKNLSTGLYHCSICDKPLKRADTVRLHYDAIHLNKKFNCDGCSRPFSQYAGLQQHKKICNGVATVKIQKRKVYYTRDSVTGMFQCTKCERKSPTYTTIVLHYESIHLRKRYKCEICNNQVFKQMNSLKKHKKTCRELIEDCLIKDGEQINVVCKLCRKQFPSMKSFGVHRRKLHLKNDPGT